MRCFSPAVSSRPTAFAGVSVPAAPPRGVAQGAANRSFIGGVQFGLQPFCYHDLPMTRETRGELLRRLVLNGMGLVELHAAWCEPNFAGPGVSAADARNRLRQWRLGDTADGFRAIRRQFDDAGVTIGSYYINIGASHTDAEIDASFRAARLLGASTVVLIGLHNHDKLSDPDAFASEASIVTGVGVAAEFRAMLDVRHLTAANGDAVGLLQRHHDRVVGVHLGDRRRNNGRSTPFGLQVVKIQGKFRGWDVREWVPLATSVRVAARRPNPAVPA